MLVNNDLNLIAKNYMKLYEIINESSAFSKFHPFANR